jgi:hypothetical protein
MCDNRLYVTRIRPEAGGRSSTAAMSSVAVCADTALVVAAPQFHLQFGRVTAVAIATGPPRQLREFCE